MNQKEQQIEALKIYVRIGVYTINEARKKLGEAPRSEPEADKLMVLTSGRGWLTLDNHPARVVVEDLLPNAFQRDVGGPVA
jgi:hypothetical protein